MVRYDKGILVFMNEPSSPDLGIKLSFLMLGMATLFPWNSYLKAFGYFQLVFQGSNHETVFAGYVSTTFTACLFIAMFSMVVFRIDSSVALRTRITLGLFGNLLLMIGMTLIPLLDVLRWPLPTFMFFWIVLGIAGLTGVAIAVLMKSCFELVALFPAFTVPAYNAGQAASGVFVSGTAVLTAALSSASPANMVLFTVFYFAVAVVVLGLTMVSFLKLQKTSLFRSAIVATHIPIEDKSIPISFVDSFKMVWDLALGICCTLIVTLGLITSYIPMAKSFGIGTWSAIFTATSFALYDIGDLVGRWLPSFAIFSLGSAIPHFIPWARLIIFIPLFMMSNVNLQPDLRNVFPLLIRNDGIFLLITLLFGISNGLGSTSLMMKIGGAVPKRCPSTVNLDQAKQHAGSIIGLAINVGLLLGTFFGLLLVRTVTV